MSWEELLIAAAKTALVVGSIGFILFTFFLLLTKMGGLR